MVTFDRETNLPIYETPDEIPINERIIPPISIDWFPKYNLVSKFMDYLSKISDTYPEYAMQGGLTILSMIARRRICVKVNGSFLYAMLWFVILGASGISRKTVAVKTARNVLKAVTGDAAVLSNDVTPQGLIEAMTTTYFKASSGKDSTGWVDVSEKYADEECKILRSQRVYIRDEASKMYAQMKNHGKDSLEDLFLWLHSGENYSKILVSKKQVIEYPFFSMLVALTPQGFKKYMTKENVATGFVTRNLFTNPEYENARKALQEEGESDAQALQDLISDFKFLDSALGDGETSIRAGFQDGVLEMLDAWVCERETYYRKKRDEEHLVFIPRYQENALSMALLIELGNIPHIVEERGENKNILLTSLKISKASMGLALKLIDSVFAPYHDTLVP